jgi:hypothetical protein
MGATAMRDKIGTNQFNAHLFGLVNAAMADGVMGPFEINGAMFAAMQYVDRTALAAAQKQNKNLVEPVVKMPALPPIKPGDKKP